MEQPKVIEMPKNKSEAYKEMINTLFKKDQEFIQSLPIAERAKLNIQ